MTSSSFRVLLPPSETKAVGGDRPSVQLSTLLLPELEKHRRQAIRRVMDSSAHSNAAQHFKLGTKLLGELEHNRQLLKAATMPAIRRYTGVLYEQISTSSFNDNDWAYAHDHLVIHSALFGPIRATDCIPKYRLSAGTVLPEFSVSRFWSSLLSEPLESTADWFLDLRAKQYQALAPIRTKPVIQLEIVSEDRQGVRRALNHFNKQSKGAIVAALIRSKPQITTVNELADWFHAENFRVDQLDLHHWQFISG